MRIGVALLFILWAGVSVSADDTDRHYRRWFAPLDKIDQWPFPPGKNVPMNRQHFEDALKQYAQRRQTGFTKISLTGTDNGQDTLTGSGQIVYSGAESAVSVVPLLTNISMDGLRWEDGSEGFIISNGSGHSALFIAAQGQELTFRWSLPMKRLTDTQVAADFVLPVSLNTNVILRLPENIVLSANNGIVTPLNTADSFKSWNIAPGIHTQTALLLTDTAAQSQRQIPYSETRHYRIMPYGLEITGELKLESGEWKIESSELKIGDEKDNDCQLSTLNAQLIAYRITLPLQENTEWELPKIHLPEMYSAKETYCTVNVQPPMQILGVRCENGTQITPRKNLEQPADWAEDTVLAFYRDASRPALSVFLEVQYTEPAVTATAVTNVRWNHNELQATSVVECSLEQGTCFAVKIPVQQNWLIDKVKVRDDVSRMQWDISADTLIVQLAEPVRPNKPVTLEITGHYTQNVPQDVSGTAFVPLQLPSQTMTVQRQTKDAEPEIPPPVSRPPPLILIWNLQINTRYEAPGRFTNTAVFSIENRGSNTLTVTLPAEAKNVRWNSSPLTVSCSQFPVFHCRLETGNWELTAEYLTAGSAGSITADAPIMSEHQTMTILPEFTALTPTRIVRNETLTALQYFAFLLAVLLASRGYPVSIFVLLGATAVVWFYLPVASPIAQGVFWGLCVSLGFAALRTRIAAKTGNSVSRTIVVACILACTGTAAEPQEAYRVFYPTDTEGKVVGNEVWVPYELFHLLESVSPQQRAGVPNGWAFYKAEYHLAAGSPQVTANFGILITGNVEEIVIPNLSAANIKIQSISWDGAFAGTFEVRRTDLTLPVPDASAGKHSVSILFTVQDASAEKQPDFLTFPIPKIFNSILRIVDNTDSSSDNIVHRKITSVNNRPVPEGLLSSVPVNNADQITVQWKEQQDVRKEVAVPDVTRTEPPPIPVLLTSAQQVILKTSASVFEVVGKLDSRTAEVFQQNCTFSGDVDIDQCSVLDEQQNPAEFVLHRTHRTAMLLFKKPLTGRFTVKIAGKFAVPPALKGKKKFCDVPLAFFGNTIGSADTGETFSLFRLPETAVDIKSPQQGWTQVGTKGAAPKNFPAAIPLQIFKRQNNGTPAGSISVAVADHDRPQVADTPQPVIPPEILFTDIVFLVQHTGTVLASATLDVKTGVSGNYTLQLPAEILDVTIFGQGLRSGTKHPNIIPLDASPFPQRLNLLFRTGSRGTEFSLPVPVLKNADGETVPVQKTLWTVAFEESDAVSCRAGNVSRTLLAGRNARLTLAAADLLREQSLLWLLSSLPPELLQSDKAKIWYAHWLHEWNRTAKRIETLPAEMLTDHCFADIKANFLLGDEQNLIAAFLETLSPKAAEALTLAKQQNAPIADPSIVSEATAAATMPQKAGCRQDAALTYLFGAKGGTVEEIVLSDFTEKLYSGRWQTIGNNAVFWTTGIILFAIFAGRKRLLLFIRKLSRNLFGTKILRRSNEQ